MSVINYFDIILFFFCLLRLSISRLALLFVTVTVVVSRFTSVQRAANVLRSVVQPAAELADSSCIRKRKMEKKNVYKRRRTYLGHSVSRFIVTIHKVLNGHYRVRPNKYLQCFTFKTHGG